MKPVRVVISGSRGRMGQTLAKCLPTEPGMELVGGVDLGDDLASVLPAADVLIEFALPEATLPNARLCAQHRKAMVIGTTGHTAAQRDQIRAAIAELPVVWTGNFSTGVNTLFWLTRRVAEIVGRDWNVEIVETHHTAKKDAPSGTARQLQAIVAAVRGAEPPAHALRIGDVVGDHTVTFGTVGERLELTHRANSREIFARGALRAARWVVQQPPGLYDMQDVLGLK
ncbi:MAG: 4-hydroxy-tetrahydrodipicolinate reductase [Verrucomicrobiae bacterium]|nr:4-hydroxy-tetrahydrodipicolinate reductase [Verrucomicrobiae bacterium]